MSTFIYRVVNLILDPVIGHHIPVGAIARSETGKIYTAPAPFIPDARCLGGEAFYWQADHVRSQLESVNEFGSLPPHFGPCVSLGAPMKMPPGVANPVPWLKALLPQDTGAVATVSGRHHLATRGYQFFETYGLAQYVERRFKPHLYWSENPALADTMSLLEPVSHFVVGESRLLLMEPLSVDRRQYKKDLTKVAQRFGAFRYHLGGMLNELNVNLVAYITAQGSQERRTEVAEQLVADGSAHMVIDTSITEDRGAFLRDIRVTGDRDTLFN